MSASAASNPLQVGSAFAGHLVDVEVDTETGKVEVLLRQIVEGVDADGDGIVRGDLDEGGLAQVEQHMAHMAEGEGLI